MAICYANSELLSALTDRHMDTNLHLNFTLQRGCQSNVHFMVIVLCEWQKSLVNNWTFGRHNSLSANIWLVEARRRREKLFCLVFFSREGDICWPRAFTSNLSLNNNKQFTNRMIIPNTIWMITMGGGWVWAMRCDWTQLTSHKSVDPSADAPVLLQRHRIFRSICMLAASIRIWRLEITLQTKLLTSVV